jgi:formylmethanofuran dehydrogenase subunit E
MESIDELLDKCELVHGHLCPGQLLGVRIAVLGCRLVGIQDPRGADRKKLIVWVEIDRRMADAVGAVTGTRLGRRTLKFLDSGKVAATFLNVDTGDAVRVVALESSRCLADQRHPEIQNKKARQMHTYREVTNEELFAVNVVKVSLSEMDAPGHPRSRVMCRQCGEGVNDGREISEPDGSTLCRSCALGAYYQPRQKLVTNERSEKPLPISSAFISI